MANKFRLPNEMNKESGPKVPISARVRESIRNHLVKVAKKEGMSLSELIEQVIEDYAAYLKDKGY
jgi:predicted HicB family RNase H-like nuclease